jgi:L-alanine-DL-glutamate epimerase-like enolase superfamily enzyme
MQRRNFLKTAMATGMLAAAVKSGHGDEAGMLAHRLAAAESAAVLKKELFKEPVLITSAQLLRNGDHFIVRVESDRGAVGMAVSNDMHMIYLYPVLTGKVLPFFVNKDARELEKLLSGLYRANSNYKWQGLAFWVCVASLEFAILDLLGQIAGKPVGELLGAIVRRDVAVYQANGVRDKSAEETVEQLLRSVEKTGARAVKYKVGGRMDNNRDSLPGRTEKLIQLARKALPATITIYADANGSYDASKAIEIGRLLEENGVAFFEEPCPFDHYGETRSVADVLTIPIAGGEQEPSLRQFRWMIENNVLQVVQPDLFYFGGMVRSVRVARMALEAGIPCTPHISGSGLGYLYMLHFASCVDNIGPYQEYKGENPEVPIVCATSSLRSEKGIVKVPTGPGWGVQIEKGFLDQCRLVE